MQRKKSYFVYASAISIVGVLVSLSATPGFARQVKNTVQDNSYQLQSAASSYAYEPQTVAMIARRGQMLDRYGRKPSVRLHGLLRQPAGV